ncbi:MAG TPA: isoprenylcysteine carboxylmethyltransferase family protein [Burkholderiales bacterium]|nr:isoprenylcysteine carboxylmethyltransferase family protein [Burkholderiales bacterium]
MAEWLENRVPPPVVAACVGALMLGAAWVLPLFEFGVPWGFAAATAAAGVAVGVAGVAQFGRARTTLNPLKPDEASALVTGGIYRWTRNPMYLGMALVLAGWGLFIGNFGALALVGLFVMYIDRFQIDPEERALEERFDDKFTAYRKRVRRWL